jgi:SAM-dependent methyltransferase
LVLKLLEVKPGARILDLCCGPGRHSLELARRGCRVTGVDRTALYLKKARAAARREKLDIEFVLKDMRRFRRPGAFDGAINLFTSFGYFRSPADDCRVVANLLHSLRPGGRLVMEMAGREVLARKFSERAWSEQDGALLLEERKMTQDWSWIENRWIVIKGARKAMGQSAGRDRPRLSAQEFRFGLRIYSARELRTLLESVGFERVRCYGSLRGTPYDHTAERLVVVARKP